jgi:hypothetical protein
MNLYSKVSFFGEISNDYIYIYQLLCIKNKQFLSFLNQPLQAFTIEYH